MSLSFTDELLIKELEISPRVLNFVKEAEAEVVDQFAALDDVTA